VIGAWLLQSSLWDELRFRFQSLADASARGLADLLLAVLIMLAGWGLSFLVAWLVRWMLGVTRFDAGMERLFGHGRGPEPSVFVAWIAQGAVLVASMLLALDLLGFDLTSSLIARLGEMLPRLIAGGVVLAIGMLVAMLLGALTRRFVESSGMRGARLRGQIVSGVVVGFTVLLALEQLGLAAQFVFTLVIVALAGLALALALAFGLGCGDLARNFVVEYLRSLEDEGPRRSE
jgi:prepilin signal peptidase PulO-like enzyme (type II secretory pathway)